MITDQKINKIVGAYLMGNDKENMTQLAVGFKPNWFRRICTQLFLGWKWVNIKELKK